MFIPRGRPHVILFVLLIAGAPGRAAPGPAALPKGVITRLGTDRLRHEHNVLAATFAPDGKTIVSVGGGWHLRSWDLTGKEVRSIPLDVKKPLAVVQFTPDSKTLLLAGYDGKVRLFDVRTGKELGTVATKPGPAALALSPDGKTLITAHQSQLVHVWDVASRKEKLLPAELTLRGPALAFTPDGKRLVTGWTDNFLRLIDLRGNKVVRSFPMLPRNFYGRKMLAFSPDGRLLAVVGWGHTVRLWDPDTGKEVRQLSLAPPSPYSGAFSASVAFAPDGKTLAAGGPGTVQLWDLKSGKELRRIKAHTGYVHSVAFSPDGKMLVSAGRDQAIGLWDVASGKDLNPKVGHRGTVRYLAFADRGGMLFSAGDDGTVRLWDADAGEQEEVLAQHPGPVTAFLVTRGGKEVMSTANNGGIQVWRAGVGRKAARRTGISFGGTVPMLFTPDAKTWIVGFGAQIHLRNPGPGGPRQTLSVGAAAGGFYGVVRLAASPDSRLLAAAYRDKSVRLWDLATGKEVRRMRSGLDDFGDYRSNGLLFAPDGRTLAAPGIGTLYLWEVATGQECVRFPALSTRVSALAFSPDGRLLAVAQESDPPGPGRLRVLDTATGKEIGRTTAHRGVIESLAFSTDGKLLASGGRDTTILGWKVAELADLPKAPPALSAKQVAACWDDLADGKAEKAHRAIWSLVQSPREAVPFLGEHLKSPGRPDAKRVARLLKELDDDNFEVREKASRELATLGAAVEDELRKALRDTPSAEVRDRLRDLLVKMKHGGKSPERQRLLRALAVLERVGTPAAREVVTGLARQKLDAALMEQVQATLQRLGERH